MEPLDALLERLWSTPAPPEVRRKARRIALDTLGCALAALEHPAVRSLAARLGEMDDGRVALGSLDARLAPSAACAVLAAAACWDEACEGLARAHGRPGVPVAAACMGLGLKLNVAMKDFIEALVAGYEVGARMGERLRIRPGMHVDGCWPALGAAAGASRLLGEPPATARAAIEIAASQLPFSLYLPVEQGADARNTYLAHAAWLGAFAASAACSGVAAPSGAIERFAALALSNAGLPAYAGGDRYLILDAYLKGYAAVRHVHYGAEAALRLRSRIRTVEAANLAIYPEAVQYCGNRAPRTPIQAQFSLSFGVAAALRFGRLDAAVYRAPEFEDAELRRLEGLVRVRAEEALGQGGRREAVLRIGALEERVSVLKGDPARPFTDGEVAAKFMHAASPSLGRAAAEGLAVRLLEADETAPLRAVLEPAMRYN
ncbi:MAG TPA: MmgE/PrpD family protein [Burkholderiales bacterium]|nr:MmgE/PrpD family protein [Burkholderiales bacterium]